jgi:hypothetical protein
MSFHCFVCELSFETGQALGLLRKRGKRNKAWLYPYHVAIATNAIGLTFAKIEWVADAAPSLKLSARKNPSLEVTPH